MMLRAFQGRVGVSPETRAPQPGGGSQRWGIIRTRSAPSLSPRSCCQGQGRGTAPQTRRGPTVHLRGNLPALPGLAHRARCPHCAASLPSWQLRPRPGALLALPPLPGAAPLLLRPLLQAVQWGPSCSSARPPADGAMACCPWRTLAQGTAGGRGPWPGPTAAHLPAALCCLQSRPSLRDSASGAGVMSQSWCWEVSPLFSISTRLACLWTGLSHWLLAALSSCRPALCRLGTTTCSSGPSSQEAVDHRWVALVASVVTPIRASPGGGGRRGVSSTEHGVLTSICSLFPPPCLDSALSSLKCELWTFL